MTAPKADTYNINIHAGGYSGGTPKGKHKIYGIAKTTHSYEVMLYEDTGRYILNVPFTDATRQWCYKRGSSMPLHLETVYNRLNNPESNA